MKGIIYEHLDPNQQAEGNRTREFYGWKFRVSANNKILNPSFPFTSSDYSESYAESPSSTDFMDPLITNDDPLNSFDWH
jgi:hypothetical protein